MSSKSVTASITSAVLMIFAFPPFDVWIIGWFGIVPLFFAVHDKKPGKAFLIGFIWGFVFFSGTVYWVVNSMVNYGGVSVGASISALLLLVVVLSLYSAVFGCLAFSLRPRALSLFLIPCLWVSLEYLRTYLFIIGFPWVLLGYSQTAFLPIMQIADITGVYGVSFLIIMTNWFLFRIVKGIKEYSFSCLRRHYKEGIAVFSILILTIGYGYFRIGQIDNLTKDWKELKIGIAQGNIDQSYKWDPEYQEETVKVYKRLSEEIINKSQISNPKSEKVDFIVWPETAAPFYLQSDEKLGRAVFDIAETLSANLVVGSPSYRYSEDRLTASYFNSVFLVSKKGEIVGRYDKVRLVPFGEYVPLKRFLPFEKLVAGAGDFSAGKETKPLLSNNVSIGILICFEAIFPNLAKGFLNYDADFLITVTNDAWFGRTSAPYQHLSQSLVRAIEGRVFLVRSANTGISAVIDPIGRIKQKSDLFSRQTLIDTISLKEKGYKTFYTRYGDVFAVGCIIIMVLQFIMIKGKGDRFIFHFSLASLALYTQSFYLAFLQHLQ